VDHPDYIRSARYSDLFAEPRQEGPSDCAYCPICAAIGAVRKTRPEVLDHLATAARELILAAGILLEEMGEALGGNDIPEHDHSSHQAPTPSNVTRIDGA